MPWCVTHKINTIKFLIRADRYFLTNAVSGCRHKDFQIYLYNTCSFELDQKPISCTLRLDLGQLVRFLVVEKVGNQNR